MDKQGAGPPADELLVSYAGTIYMRPVDRGICLAPDGEGGELGEMVDGGGLGLRDGFYTARLEIWGRPEQRLPVYGEEGLR